MKRGTVDHPKTHALAAELQIKRWGAVGLLESLWHFTAQYALAGDIGRHTDDSIARAICWDDPSVTLVRGLVVTGWLDRCACHRLRVHDWKQHADQTVQRVLTNRHQEFIACYDDPSTKLESSYPSVAVAVAVPLPGPKANTNGNGLFRPSDDVLAVWSYFLERSHFAPRTAKAVEAGQKRIAARLKEGSSVEDLKRCVDVACFDPYYVEQGYYRRSDVLFRSAERINTLLAKLHHAGEKRAAGVE